MEIVLYAPIFPTQASIREGDGSVRTRLHRRRDRGRRALCLRQGRSRTTRTRRRAAPAAAGARGRAGAVCQPAHPPGRGRLLPPGGGGGGRGGLHLRQGRSRPAGPRRRAASAAADAGAAGALCGLARRHDLLRQRAHDGGDGGGARVDLRLQRSRPAGRGRHGKQAGVHAVGRRRKDLLRPHHVVVGTRLLLVSPRPS